VLFLREKDVKIICDLMMGGDGTNTDGELSEMHMSCISEAMNQMMGSSSTSLAKMLNLPIDISPPQAYSVNLRNGAGDPFTSMDEVIVRIGFNMVVEGLIDSEIMQVTPVSFAKKMVESLVSTPEEEPVAPPPPVAAPASQPNPGNYTSPFNNNPPAAPYPPPPPQNPQGTYGYNPAPAPYGYGQGPAGYYAPPQQPVDYRSMQYQPFDEATPIPGGENMNLLMDVPLSVTVELGKSKKFIKEIIDFNIGTVVVLDKMAGELVDVVVNGKLIAKGEVVVIDENYGVRITDIISPSKRIGGGNG
jgi:flagellar motor switch protein FliN/FliY